MRVRAIEQDAQQRQRLADVGAIAAQIVHDIGNPLAGLSMQAQLILRRLARDPAAPSEAVRKPAEQILATVAHLDGVVKAFLAASHVHRLQLTAVALPRFLKEIVDLWQPVARARAIDVCLEADRPVEIRADEAQLRRVFDNLVRNAVEAIERGPGQVRIALGTSAAETVRISIEDTGPGIPDGIQLFRLLETTKPQGTGLGLAIARQIVWAHGGRIGATNREPHGAAFRVELLRHGPGRPPAAISGSDRRSSSLRHGMQARHRSA